MRVISFVLDPVVCTIPQFMHLIAIESGIILPHYMFIHPSLFTHYSFIHTHTHAPKVQDYRQTGIPTFAHQVQIEKTGLTTST